jgi:hypothetical protein
MARYAAFPTGEFDPRAFDMLLNSSPLTYRVIHKRADLCPCFDSGRGSPDYDCPVCNGVGYAWAAPATSAYSDTLIRGNTLRPERASKALIDPATLVVTLDDDTIVAGVTLDANGAPIFPPGTAPPDGHAYTLTYSAPQQGRAHVQSHTKQRDLTDRGEIVAGHAEATLPRHLEDLTSPNPAWGASEHDRLLLPDMRYRHQQRMVRGRNERLTYAHVHSIREARAVVNNALTTYARDTAFTLANGAITWLGGFGPPHGTAYVLDYLAAPEYYVWQEIPQQRHVDGHDLPRRVSLRLFEQYPYRGA